MTSSELLQKYNVQAPRYTSYPTVPFWQKDPLKATDWISHVKTAFRKEPAISLYIHLPYCESMCTFCGCNKRITKNHKVEMPYIESLLKEWQLYLDIFDQKPVIKEIHLGGGTPTFFAPENLKHLIQGITKNANLAPDAELGFEVHPASTTYEHLETLYQLGFRRLSIGVQDFDNEILKIINRHQPYESIERVNRQARALGYTSINFDLVFGLPLQTPKHIKQTIARTNQLRPDRIAFYSYAHVPWVSPGQRAYAESDLPLGVDKRKLYELGCQLLVESGYQEIGMDHFALTSDPLFQAKQNGTLHRNFMGYTPVSTGLMIGLGASSISDSWTAFSQNEKRIESYQQMVKAGQFPILRGHELSTEDQYIRKHILRLMCQNETELTHCKLPAAVVEGILSELQAYEADGLITIDKKSIKVSDAGIPFIRNICMPFDQKLKQQPVKEKVFSQVV